MNIFNLSISQDLDLLLYISVPDKLVNDRRNYLFLQSILRATKEANLGKDIEDLVIDKR